MAVDLTFAKSGDTYATYSGWTATIVDFQWPTVRGWIDTNYCRHDCYWKLDGTAETRSDDLVGKIP